MNIKRLNVWAWWLMIGLGYFLLMTLAYHFSVINGEGGLDLPRKFGGGKDSEFYYENIVASFLTGSITNPTGTRFVPMMTAVSEFFGFTSVYLIKSINMLGVFVLLFLLVKLVRAVGNENQIETDNSAMAVLIRFALFPSALIVVGTTMGRDIWIYIFFVLSALFAVKMVQSKMGILYLPLLILAIYGLYIFRGYAGLSVIVGMVLFFVLKYANKYLIFLALIVGAGVFFSWFQIYKEFRAPIVDMTLIDALGYQGGYFSDAEGIKIYQRKGGTYFMEAFNTSNFTIFIWQFLKSYVGNLIGPFAWQARTPNLLLIFVTESVPMIFLIMRVVFEFRKKFVRFLLNNSGAMLLLCQGFSWLTMLALSNKNIGSGMRLKVPLFLFIWVVYYVFLAYQKQSKSVN